MSGLEALVPLIYHEKQQSGSQLCAQHALNAILQGDYFSAPDLAQFATQLDSLEESVNHDASLVSNNMDDTGFFSVQVLERALKVWGFTLVRWRSQDLRDQQETPHAQMSFVLNHRQHWFTLRRFGTLEDSDNGHWFNLNSFLKEPEWVGKLYLGMVLSQAEDDGYSVFAVLPTGEAPDGPTTLPRTEADEVASTLPEPTSANMDGRFSTSHVSPSADATGASSKPPGLEDEDLELQAALQASLGVQGNIDFASLTQGLSVPHARPTSSFSTPLMPNTRLDEPQVDPGTADDPVAASMARSKAIMERMLRQQEMALREGYDDEAAFGFGDTHGAGAAARRASESSRVPEARTAGQEEEEEAVRKAIEESRAESNEASMPSAMDVEDSDNEWRPAQEAARPSDASPFGDVGHRVYDDEDSELQAALKASLEGMPEGFVVPRTPPHASAPPAPSVHVESDPIVAEKAETVKPSEEVDPEEMRRRRLARFGGQPS